MYVIEVTEDKAMDMKEKAKKILKYGKELFECIEELAEGSQMGERGGYGRYGNRGSYGGGNSGGGGYGNRMGYREDDEEWDEDDDRMGERRGRSSRSGRYMRR